MIQKTTPTLQFNVEGFDLTSYEVYVYVRQGMNIITKAPADVSVEKDGENSLVTTELTEAETLSLYTGTAKAQIWATDGNGSISCEAIPFEVSQILNPEMLEEG